MAVNNKNDMSKYEFGIVNILATAMLLLGSVLLITDESADTLMKVAYCGSILLSILMYISIWIDSIKIKSKVMRAREKAIKAEKKALKNAKKDAKRAEKNLEKEFHKVYKRVCKRIYKEIKLGNDMIDLDTMFTYYDKFTDMVVSKLNTDKKFQEMVFFKCFIKSGIIFWRFKEVN
jgi:hypothetical protein